MEKECRDALWGEVLSGREVVKRTAAGRNGISTLGRRRSISQGKKNKVIKIPKDSISLFWESLYTNSLRSNEREKKLFDC